ncbi:uncharacterized protein LOC134854130 isoform X2 [Symsagittifera roscoffensis]|uniref:uncharacterized protein LOC134854130 isoform X2 n=1 Tax=Symsagittifera roscoffensis TaxID=84072 RepID=UPI00307B50BD
MMPGWRGGQCSVRMDEIERLSDDELRSKLKTFSTFVGPITDSTRRVYQLKLSNHLNEGSGASGDSKSSTTASYSTSPSDINEGFPNEYRPSVNEAQPRSPLSSANGGHYTSPKASSSAMPRAEQNNNPPMVQKSPFSYNRIGDRQPPSVQQRQSMGGDYLEDMRGDGYTGPGGDGTPQRTALEGGGLFKGRFSDVEVRNKSSASSGSREQSLYGQMNSANLTSTPHNYPNSPAAGGLTGRSSIGVTPVSAFSNSSSPGGTHSSKLFGDVPVKYPQMRQRIQPTAGHTPSQASQFARDSHQPYSGGVRRNVAQPAPLDKRTSTGAERKNQSPGNTTTGSQIVKYFKLTLYTVLALFVVMGVLVFVNMEPTLNV